jgi:hypothetical protein
MPFASRIRSTIDASAGTTTALPNGPSPGGTALAIAHAANDAAATTKRAERDKAFRRVLVAALIGGRRPRRAQ